jgi:hypothetical protein
VRARPSLPAHVTLTPNYHYLNSALLAVELADHVCLTIDLRYYQAAFDDLDFMCWQLAVLLRSGKIIETLKVRFGREASQYCALL